MFDKPQIRIDYRDVEDPQARAKLLQLAGAEPGAPLPPLAPGIAEQAARGTNTLAPDEQNGQTQDPINPIDLGDIYKQTTDPAVKQEIEQLAGLHPQGSQLPPETALKADQQAHQQEMDKANMMLQAQQQAHAQTLAEHEHQLAIKQANKPQPKVKK